MNATEWGVLRHTVARVKRIMLVSAPLADGRAPRDDETLSTTIMREVARSEGVPVVELASINDIIDPDALEAIFAPRYNGHDRTDGHVTFTYHSYEVIVTGNRTIDLEPLDDQQK